MHKFVKKSLSVFLSLLMVFSLFGGLSLPAGAAADVWDGTWDGSGFGINATLEYHITSAKGFAQFINNVSAGTSYSGKTVYLDVDIDLNSIDFGNISGGKNVYSNKDSFFEGMFDGQDHTIANFSMHSSDHRAALFRSARGAIFKDLTFTNVLVGDNGNNNKNGFAVLVGYGKSRLSFTDVRVESGSVSGCNYVGGFIGEYDDNEDLTFQNCSNGADIYANGERAGGLVAHSKGNVFAIRCSNTGDITAADSDAGGIAGWIEDDASSFMECANSGSVIGGACAGGIFGYVGSKSQNKNVTLNTCTNSGEIESAFSNVAYAAGGLAGKIETNGEHSFIGNVNTGYVHAKGDAGGIVGSNFGSGEWNNNRNSGKVSCDTDNAGGIVGEVEDDKQTFANCYNAAEVTGHFSTGGIVGYIGTANGNEFTDCGNTGAILSTNGSAGGILGVGKKFNAFDKCFNIGAIKGNNNSGGIEGFNDGYHAVYKQSFNAGSVGQYNSTGKNYGGIVGQVNVIGSNTREENEMEECYNWGAVNGGCAGGLIGYINNGSDAYDIGSSYNTGAVTGTTQTQPFVGSGGYLNSGCFQSINSGAGNYKAPEDMEKYNFSVSPSFVKNTWGVRVGDATFKGPVLTWYRDMFTFETKFVDEATETNVEYLNTLGESFTVPNPTREGYSAGHWLSGNTHRLVPGQTVTVGDYLTNTNNDKTIDAVNTNTVIHSFSEPTVVRSTRTYTLTWEQGATANMFAMMTVEEENNPNNRTRSGIDYTIHNLTTGHDTYFSAANGDTTTGHSNYYQSTVNKFNYNTYQSSGAGSATATLEVDRSRYNKIEDTGIYIEYYPFAYSSYGSLCWGVEIFDPDNNYSLTPKYGFMNGDYCEATVKSAERNSYDYELHFGSVDGPMRCATTSNDFPHEAVVTADTEQRGGPYQWYFTGNAPGVDESVTLRIMALCGARYLYRRDNTPSTELNILSAYTDVTIKGVCSHRDNTALQHRTASVGANCQTGGGVEHWYCSYCKKYFADAAATVELTENEALHGNEYGPHKFTKETANQDTLKAAATCTEAAEYYYSCSVCGEVERNDEHTFRSGSALDHNYQFDSFVWSADGTNAQAKYVCTHDENHVLTYDAQMSSFSQEPTCTTDGFTVYTATYDGHTENNKVTDTGTATDHTYVEPAEEDWAWAEHGDTFTAKVTLTCQENDFTVTIGASVSKTEDVPASLTAPGYKVFTATALINDQTFTATKRVTVPVVEGEEEEHQIVFVPKANSTCTDVGWEAHFKCTLCETLFADAEGTQPTTFEDLVIGLKDHVAKTPATCTTKAVCANCGQSFGEFDLTNHTPGDWIVDKEATCNEAGSKHQECAVCHDTISTEEIPTDTAAHALIHVDAEAATAEAEGKVEHYHCTVCGKNFSDAEGTDELTTVTIDKLPEQEEPTTEKPDNPAPQNPDHSGGNAKGKCPYCGGTHTGFFGWFVKLFHFTLALFGLHS